jgi:peptidoglycan-associated lipoprotein
MKNVFLISCAVIFLAACGTNVPLNDVPVSDATVRAVSEVDASSNANANGMSSGVAAVNLGQGSAGSSATASAPAETKVIYFDYDSYVIRPEFQSVIAAHARFVKVQQNRKVAIEGHTDETGGREYNLALGQKRAEAVRGALAILGVSQTQMEAVSFGKEKPAVAGNDESAFSKNRRVEIRYQ